MRISYLRLFAAVALVISVGSLAASVSANESIHSRELLVGGTSYHTAVHRCKSFDCTSGTILEISRGSGLTKASVRIGNDTSIVDEIWSFGDRLGIIGRRSSRLWVVTILNRSDLTLVDTFRALEPCRSPSGRYVAFKDPIWRHLGDRPVVSGQVSLFYDLQRSAEQNRVATGLWPAEWVAGLPYHPARMASLADFLDGESAYTVAQHQWDRESEVLYTHVINNKDATEHLVVVDFRQPAAPVARSIRLGLAELRDGQRDQATVRRAIASTHLRDGVVHLRFITSGGKSGLAEASRALAASDFEQTWEVMTR